MTLPVLPEVETILANSAQVLREVILPNLSDEWPRNCARVIAGASTRGRRSAESVTRSRTVAAIRSRCRVT